MNTSEPKIPDCGWFSPHRWGVWVDTLRTFGGCPIQERRCVKCNLLDTRASER